MARVELLTAGWTEHPGAVARRGAGWAPVRFPALVALIEHPRGRVLFDTGYAPRVPRLLRRGIDRVYGTLLPVHLDPAQSVLAQLHARGLDAADIDWVVLSHLHADHVGGLLDFPTARVVADPGAVAQAQALRGLGRLRRGVVGGLLPPDLLRRLVDPATLPVGSTDDWAPLGPAHDLLGDGELQVLPLPGHAPGHLGLAVRTHVPAHPELLLIGDAGWHARAVSHGELPHPVTRIATEDPTGYRATLAQLGDLARRRPGLIVLPSHDQAAIDTARELLA